MKVSIGNICRLGVSLLALVVTACHRRDAPISADRADASPSPSSKPSAAPSVPVDPFTSTALPDDCKFRRAFTTDAWLTLALIDGSRIVADEGECDVAQDDALWITLGFFGERVGEVKRVTTPSEGNTFALVSGTRGANVYVRGPWSFVSYRWTPEPADESALRASLSSSAVRRIVFFRDRGDLRFAGVDEERQSSVFEEKAGRSWERVHRDENTRLAWPVYEIRAVVDMNDDGTPEVIEHVNEEADGRGYDVVLQRDPADGLWDSVANNRDDGP